jgi:hypothetical protein
MSIVAGCSNQPLKQYVTPSYKTIGKSLECTQLTDARTNEDDRSALMTVAPVKKIELIRLKESQLFKDVFNTDVASGQQDYTLGGKVTDYGIDYSMSTWTWMPNVIEAGLFTVLGVVVGYPAIIAAGLVISGLDFLIEGVAGKRQYDHAYKMGLDLQLADKTGSVVWRDTVHYIYSLRFTHWALTSNTNGFGQSSTGIAINNVDEINNAALEVVTDQAMEQVLAEMAPVLGSQRLSLADPSDSFERTIELPSGKVEVSGRRIRG